MPRPVPSDRLAGLVDQTATAFGKVCVALVAVHAVRPTWLPKLMLADLDRTRWRLTIRLVGIDHLVYLDEFTARLMTDWLAVRYRQWPRCRNPHLLVTRRTAIHADTPPAHKEAVLYYFRRAGIGAQKLWTDRILDEAAHIEDPVQLMHQFGLSITTAVKHDQAAHPEKYGIDPTQA
ncbi:hypothetical protein [Streptomyces sp. NPDC058280]|uniref:hypothetical protein n=1 Tax=Streptomyces sp. NPDC058280 TaxID=3346419 RepID=UPI0036EBE724